MKNEDRYKWRHFKSETPDNRSEIIFENDGVICEGSWLEREKHILVPQKVGFHHVYRIGQDCEHNVRFWMYKPNFDRACMMLDDSNIISDEDVDLKAFRARRGLGREWMDLSYDNLFQKLEYAIEASNRLESPNLIARLIVDFLHLNLHQQEHSADTFHENFQILISEIDNLKKKLGAND